MRKPGLALAILFTASTALAHTGVKDKNVLAWMDGMQGISDEVKILTRMARGQIPHDTAAAKAAIATMQDEARRIPDLFEKKANDPKSEARPRIWKDWENFVGHAEDLDVALMNADTSSPSAIGLSMREIGKPCRACHKAFRAEK